MTRVCSVLAPLLLFTRKRTGETFTTSLRINTIINPTYERGKMVTPLAELILKKGVWNVDSSKLTPQLRRQVFEEAGMRLQKLERHEEAAKALSIAESPNLHETLTAYMEQKQYAIAAFYALYSDDRELLERLAAECMKSGKKEAAIQLYTKSRNEEMVRFITENF